MSKLKDSLYNYFVRKNGRVWYEYERYVREHLDEHRKHRLRHLLVLFKLNWFYRVQGNTIPYLYPDVPAEPIIEEKKNVSNLPYLEGSESAIPEHERPEIFVKRLLNYDIVSFDLFDTLIIRPFVKPSDLFLILQKEYDYIDFANIRIAMEKKAKDMAFQKRGIREVTIRDIYVQVNKYTGIGIDEGIAKEFSVEKSICQPNPYMKKVFKMVKEQGKQIIVTSDMYYSSDQLQDLLEKCGFFGIDKIFVSCEHSANKSSKGLYRIISNKYKNQRIVHTGDNYKNDIINARESSWDAVLYKGVHDLGKKYRASYQGMSELTGSTYGGIVNYHLLTGNKVYSPIYEYGFIYGGLYVFGYCNWIYNYVKENRIDKVLFISRDGAIYQKVYNLLFPNSKTEYFYWSRVFCAKMTARKDRYDFLLRLIKHRINDVFPMTIFELLRMLEIRGIEEDQLEKYGLCGDDAVVEDNYVQIQNFFIDHWDLIVNHLDNHIEAVEKYIKKSIGDSKKVAVVDIGWQGSGLFGIKWLVEERFHMDCEVDCLLAGSKALNFTGNLPEEMSGKYHTYLFSRMHNRDLFDFFAHTNNHTNTGHFEMFTQAQAPTFSGVKFDAKGDLKYEFGIPEVENREKISEIHKGIIDFCILYKNIFKEYPFIYNVSGFDAIQPFKHISKNLSFIEHYLGDFVFSRNICANFDKPYLETINDVLVKQGMK